MPTETPAQYRARVAHNAAVSRAPMPRQDRSSIPSPAQQPMTLPPMRVLTKTKDPHRLGNRSK
jgi:hypothetical protein